VVRYLVEMGGRARLTTFMDTVLSWDHMEAHFRRWNLPLAQQREVLRLLHAALLSDQRHRDAAEVMTTLLRTYTDADAEAARDDAKECVRTAVIDPQTFNFDHLPRLSAVRRLEQSDPLMWAVLDIFVNQRLLQYKSFVAKHPDFVEKELKVTRAEDAEALEKKMQMLTLISLAEENSELPLDKVRMWLGGGSGIFKILAFKKEFSKSLNTPHFQVGEALGITEEDRLEEFIIDAIRLKAIGVGPLYCNVMLND